MPQSNRLYYGDNLDILRRYIKDECVDLVYVDPSFKSNQDYNVLTGRSGVSVALDAMRRLLGESNIRTR